MTRRLPVLLFASAVLFAAVPARAGLLPVQVSIAPEAGNYRWTYAIMLPSGSQLQSGDYFTIYDFAGFVADSNVQPSGWEFQSSSLGTTPDRIDPDDDPNLPNLTFRYTGPTYNPGQTGLGNFWAVSEYGDSTDSYFTARTHRTSDGKPDSNITETVVPVPVATPTIPEPTTLALAGLGLPLVVLARRWKK